MREGGQCAGKGDSHAANDALSNDNIDDISEDIDVDDEGDQNAGGAKGNAGEEPSTASCVCRICWRCRQSGEKRKMNLSTSKLFKVRPDMSVISVLLLAA